MKLRTYIFLLALLGAIAGTVVGYYFGPKWGLWVGGALFTLPIIGALGTTWGNFQLSRLDWPFKSH